MTTIGVSTLWRRLQPPLAFVSGAVILWHEVAVHTGGDRPYILLAALTLMGSAAFARADQLLRNLGISVTIGQPKEENPQDQAPPEEEGAGP